MKRLFYALVLLVLVCSFMPPAPAMAASEKPEAEVVVYGFHCFSNDVCDVGIDFTIGGYINRIGSVEWRYLLTGGRWIAWQPYVPDYARIFVPWVSGQLIAGKVQFRYRNTPAGSGLVSQDFERYLEIR